MIIIVNLGQRIREGSEPGDGGGRDQILKEHPAFVLISSKEY